MRPEQTPEKPAADSSMGHATKKRIIIAIALIAVALGTIPLFDSFKTPPQVEDAGSGKISGTLLTPSVTDTAPPMPVIASEAASQPMAPESPDLAATPGMTALPKLMVETRIASPANPIRDERSNTAPRVRPDSSTPDSHLSKNTEKTSTPPLPPPATAAPAKPQGSSFGYSVQLGLFSSPDNAQKLVAELKTRGISARSETKVQLGPFKTRAEAEDAMAELRKLGYIPLLIPLGQ
ncbi:SPOR domain-containing protein [Craterilacuibacter sp.]|uniref:SPOR domain-containing protein n=1 Tax=Craterilacuibacter sp. TaxID=2870909 RepID=UPI003F2DFA2D